MVRKNGGSAKLVSALAARSHFGELLRRLDEEDGSLVIEKRGTPKAVILSIRDYVRLAAPEPDVLRLIGHESRANGTNKLSLTQINQIIKRARRKSSSRK